MTLPPADWTSNDGRVVLYNRDCLELLPLLPQGCAHCVVTDPPYSSGTRREGSKGLRKSMNRTTGDNDWFGSDCMTTGGFVWTMRAVASQCKRILCPGGHMLSFIDWRMCPHLASAIESTDMRQIGVVVWDKVGFGMGNYFRNQHEFIVHFSHGRARQVFRRDMPNVLRHSRFLDNEHDTQKPIGLMEDLITVVSDIGEFVVDPFMGSGTTGVACVKLGRRFIGCEIDEGYFKVAVKRIAAAIEHQAGGPLFKDAERGLYDE